MKLFCLNLTRLFLPLIISGFLLQGCGSEQSSDTTPGSRKVHSLTDELKVFSDITSLPQYLDNTFSAQVSSYDTTGKNDDGFSGTYSFIRRNPDSTLVIFDVKGGGVINRIWTPTPTDDTLDFFIDSDVKPSFSIAYRDLFLGRKFPFIAPLCGNQLGGFFCYLPIPFEKSCLIVSRGKKMQFHQIQYRLYEAGARIKSFNISLNGEEREAVEKIAAIWNKEEKSVYDLFPGQLMQANGHYEIYPGRTITIFESNKGGRIAGIELEPADLFEGLYKNTDLRITWDGEDNPAVWCPVADFFGYAFGKTSMQSLLLGSRDNKCYCYFPMPYDKSVRIELVCRDSGAKKQAPADVAVKVWYTSQKRNPEQEGKFYSFWNKNLKSEPGLPHTFINVSGKGHYVATILQAQGMKAGMTYFFEGDDSTCIDGEFRMHGTGSEDYFNGGWYAMMDRWDGKMSLPLHGSLDYSLPFCRTGGYRLFLSDKLSFSKSFYHSIEHGPTGNLFPVDYTSIGLYYSNSPVPAVKGPEEEQIKVFLPDTLIIYPQLMDYNLFGNMNIITTWKYGTGGESYLFTPGPDSWLRISLKEIPKGKYAMYFDIMKEPYGCEFSLWQRQKPLSEWISAFSPKKERASGMYICDIDLTESEKSLTIRFRTSSHKEGLLLNRLTLIRK